MWTSITFSRNLLNFRKRSAIPYFRTITTKILFEPNLHYTGRTSNFFPLFWFNKLQSSIVNEQKKIGLPLSCSFASLQKKKSKKENISSLKGDLATKIKAKMASSSPSPSSKSKKDIPTSRTSQTASKKETFSNKNISASGKIENPLKIALKKQSKPKLAKSEEDLTEEWESRIDSTIEEAPSGLMEQPLAPMESRQPEYDAKLGDTIKPAIEFTEEDYKNPFLAIPFQLTNRGEVELIDHIDVVQALEVLSVAGENVAENLLSLRCLLSYKSWYLPIQKRKSPTDAPEIVTQIRESFEYFLMFSNLENYNQWKERFVKLTESAEVEPLKLDGTRSLYF